VIDAILHHERIDERGRQRIHPISGPLLALPDGAMVVAAGWAFTLCPGQACRWTNEGYASPERLSYADALLTPPSTLMALSSGYRPVLSSINQTT
jgi:hypothetical protein